MTGVERFTATGGYAFMGQDDEGRILFACANDGSRDRVPVILDKAECVHLGAWLLMQSLSLDEQGILRGLVKLAEHRLSEPMPTQPS